MTVSFDDFHQVLGQVARDFGSDSKIAEAELVNRWFMAGVFSELGYGSHRDDYRVERKIQGAGRADVVLRSFAQRARAVTEFKRPLTPLDDHVKQVREYGDRLLPDVAILTNGKDLWLYGRQGPLPLDPLRAEPSRYDLTALTPTDARILFDQLRKLEVDISNLEALTGALDDLQARPVRVEGPQSPGGVAFLERFGLDKQSVFGRLVSVLFDALPVLQYTSQFMDGAYAFWGSRLRQGAVLRRCSENLGVGIARPYWQGRGTPFHVLPGKRLCCPGQSPAGQGNARCRIP